MAGAAGEKDERHPAVPTWRNGQKSQGQNEIADKVLSSVDISAGSETREKVKNYIGLLASTGKSDKQLLLYGEAYLKEIMRPDPRYSGC